jgi:hypothetical protein
VEREQSGVDIQRHGTNDRSGERVSIEAAERYLKLAAPMRHSHSDDAGIIKTPTKRCHVDSYS